MATPQVLSHKANGVLPMLPGQTSGNAQKVAKTKTAPEGEKIVIRRLPPGLTEDEFVKILGSEWKAGNGKVSWFSYRPGKISQESVCPGEKSSHRLCVS